MKYFVAGAILLLSGCSPGLVFNASSMSSDQMLARASHVFVGIIQKQEFESWPFFHANSPGEDPATSKYWSILRREIRLEMILRGAESHKVVDVYEISANGASTVGDWNSTREGERDLFLVRVENGRYHVVRDWWRSIFPVTTGPHYRLPLDESHPLWERIALMNFWIERADEMARIGYPHFRHLDPGQALSNWRRLKLERGLVRHPSAAVRVPACEELIGFYGWGQDECWQLLSESDRLSSRLSAREVATASARLAERDATWWWQHYVGREERRWLTAANNHKLRTDMCRLYEREYPGDTDTGCPADQPPPATIVTERGDVPLIGPWPR